MINISSQQSSELVMDYAVQQFAVHYAASDHDYLRGEEQSNVKAELSEVKSNQSPNAGVIGQISQSGEVDLQTISDGFVVDHTFETGLSLMEGTDSSEVLVFMGRSFHTTLDDVYTICPPSGWVSPCKVFPPAITPTPTPVPTVI
jgi:hypothetical protein